MIKESISARQASIIVVVCILANKVLLLPSLMYEQTRADAIFSLAIMFLLDFIMLLIFLKLKDSYPNEKLYDILRKKITPFFAKLVFIVLLVCFFLKVLLTFSIVYDYLKQQVYQEEILTIALISIIPVINHAVLKGLRSFSRTIELFFILVMAGVIICLSFSLFTPISFPMFFVSSAKSVFNAAYKNFFSFGDFLILFIIIDKIDIKKGQKKLFYQYSVFGMLLIFTLFFLFYAKYQETAFIHNNALSDVLVFTVRFNAIGRLDIIAMVTIMLLTFFQLEIFSFAFCDCLINIFPLMKPWYSVAVFDVLFMIIYLYFIGKYESMVTSFGGWFPVLGILINIVFPLLCLIITFVRRKNERTS